MTGHTSSIPTVLRRHLEDLAASQEGRGVYLLTQLNSGIFDEPVMEEPRLAADNLQRVYATNIGELIRGLRQACGDAEMDVPLRGVTSEVAGATATAAAHASSHPVSATLRHARESLGEILADYTILYTLSLAAAREDLASRCLTHLVRLRELADQLLFALPTAAAYEYAGTDRGLLTVDTQAARRSLHDAFHSPDPSSGT